MNALVMEQHGAAQHAYSACVLIPDTDGGRFVAVSRRDNTRAWGLPGGKADPGEPLLETAARETLEETGLALPTALLAHVFSGDVIGTDDKHYWVSTYLWTGPVPDIQALRPEAGLQIEWKSAEQLSCTTHSPFADYHDQVFAAYARLGSCVGEAPGRLAIRPRTC